MSSVGVRLGLEFSLKEFCGDFFFLYVNKLLCIFNQKSN